jgi:hypothetical protein
MQSCALDKSPSTLFSCESDREKQLRFQLRLSQIALREISACKAPLQWHTQLPVFHQWLAFHVMPNSQKMLKSTRMIAPADCRATCHYPAEPARPFPGRNSQDRFAGLPGCVKVHAMEMDVGAGYT